MAHFSSQLEGFWLVYLGLSCISSAIGALDVAHYTLNDMQRCRKHPAARAEKDQAGTHSAETVPEGAVCALHLSAANSSLEPLSLFSSHLPGAAER